MSLNSNTPPNATPSAVAEKLLSWSLPATIREQLIGDLFEQFEQMQSEGNQTSAAQIWFWRQSVSTALFYLWQEKGGIMAFIMSVVIFIGMTLLVMLLGGRLAFYWDIPSLMIVILPAIAFGIAASSVDAGKNSLALAFVDHLDSDLANLKQSAKAACCFLDVTGTSAIWLALMSTLIGWASMGANIEAAVFSTVFGHAFAISILTLIYGLMLKLLCYAAEKKIRFRYLQD
jgi:hypothetical protein